MSNRYRGGLVNKSAPATTGGKSGSASGVWNQTQQMQALSEGNWPLPKTVPGAPTIGTVTLATNTSVSIPFSAPADNGGSAITSYTATSTPGGLTGTSAGPTGGSITISGLTPATAYTFTVYATNSLGNSPDSAVSNTVNVPTIPGAPTIGTAVLTGNTTANVPYTAPASDGGSAITSYTATSTPGGITNTIYTAGSGTIPISGLSYNTAYTFKVKATNGVGVGPESAASNSITTPQPATSIEYFVIAGGGGAGGSENHPSGGGGGGGGGGGKSTSSSAVTPGSAYTITVGGGGAGSSGLGLGNTGGASSISGIATGNGGGGGGGNAGNETGQAGGCGGGAGDNAGGVGGGNQGGNGRNSTGRQGGGGGGAGSSAGAGSGTGNGGMAGYTAFNGGVYGGGGGGGRGGVGGSGGGGTNGAGGANTGGGGGAPHGQNTNGYAGGSGRVIIRYPNTYLDAASVSGTYSYSNTGGYKYYTFTSSGSITF